MERFLAYIDKNGDNLLSIDEIIAFVSKGMAITTTREKRGKIKALYTRSCLSSSIELLVSYEKQELIIIFFYISLTIIYNDYKTIITILHYLKSKYHKLNDNYLIIK